VTTTVYEGAPHSGALVGSETGKTETACALIHMICLMGATAAADRAEQRLRDAGAGDDVLLLAVERNLARQAVREKRAAAKRAVAVVLKRPRRQVASHAPAATAVPRAAVARAAMRRARTCGGGRPAARPASRASVAATSSSDDPASPGDRTSPAPVAGRAGRLIRPARCSQSRRVRSTLRAWFERLIRRPVGGAA
jgi:hypothetical protein